MRGEVLVQATSNDPRAASLCFRGAADGRQAPRLSNVMVPIPGGKSTGGTAGDAEVSEEKSEREEDSGPKQATTHDDESKCCGGVPLAGDFRFRIGRVDRRRLSLRAQERALDSARLNRGTVPERHCQFLPKNLVPHQTEAGAGHGHC